MGETSAARYHQHRITVGPSSIDENGHVNNVEYVRWMQEAATGHAGEVGSLAALARHDATWVAREHHIKYLREAFEGDEICVQTWIAELRRVRTRRLYRFLRVADGALLAEGETHWIFISTKTGKPLSIPNDISALFEPTPNPADVPFAV